MHVSRFVYGVPGACQAGRCPYNNQMFLDNRLSGVAVRLLIGDKQHRFTGDLEVSQGQANLGELAGTVRAQHVVQTHSLLFYFDHSLSLYRLIDQIPLFAPSNAVLADRTVTFKCQPKLSDQLLANPPQKIEQECRAKRSRERTIEDAFVSVEQWRRYYREGYLNSEGKKLRCNLDQSAELIAIPRKTLEDYYWLLRTGRALQFDFRENRGEKMGMLRGFVRERGKGGKEEVDQEEFFKELRFQLMGVKPQEEIFDILHSNRSSHSSSDQDMIFQN